jgi:hypothetical protein
MLKPIECLQCRVKSELVVSLDELRGIDHDMFYLLALPSVSDVDEAVLGLDDRGIAEFLLRLIFKDQRGFPGLAVLAHGEVQRAPAFGSVVVNEQVTTISERDGVGAGVGIWQIGERNITPGLTGIVGGDLEDLTLTRSAHGLKLVAAEEENAWLDGADLQTIVQQLRAAPGFAEIGGALEVDGPGAGLRVGLVARGAKDVAIRELHGLVLDRPEDAFGQPLRCGPGFAAIGARFELAPPRARRWADFVEEHQGRVLRLKKHRIPGGMPRAICLHAIRRFDAFGPLAIGKLPRHPDTHIRIFLRRSSKPRRDEPGWRFYDGCGVNLWVRAGVVDVFRFQDSGISSVHSSDKQESKEMG